MKTESREISTYTHVRKPRAETAAYLHLKILKTIFSNNKTLRCQAVSSLLCSLKYVSTLSSHPSLGFLPQKNTLPAYLSLCQPCFPKRMNFSQS